MGTKILGMLSKEESNFVVYFNKIQNKTGQFEEFSGHLNLQTKGEQQEKRGVSEKIGKTFHKETKSNVLGAIFHNPPQRVKDLSSLVLQKGSVIEVQVD